MPGQTPRWDLPYPLGTESADGVSAVEQLALALDAVAMDDQGTLAARPVSSGGTPGKKGRYYMVKGDLTAANNGVLYRDNGTGWDVVGSGTIVDTRTNRPLANAVPSGTRFFATDQIAEWISNGTTWIRLGQQAGLAAINLTGAATAGGILLQGQAWPATTGIYTDLYAFLGNPATVPDMRRSVPAGWKSGDANFGTLLALIGEAAHTLTTPEMPAHHHDAGSLTGTLTDPGIKRGGSTGGGTNFNVDTQGSGVTITGNTGDTGGGGSHNNIQPTIVVNFEAKL